MLSARSKSTYNNSGKSRVCPFVRNPSRDCHCLEMDGQDRILKILYFCREHYEECKIYLFRTGSEKEAPGDRSETAQFGQGCRRRHLRHRVKNPSIAILTSGSPRSGQIIDISDQGLSFNYLDEVAGSFVAETLSIIVAGCGVQVDEIAFKTAWDSVIKRVSPYSFIPMRCQGVCFQGLGIEQRFHLKQFIENHTRRQ